MMPSSLFPALEQRPEAMSGGDVAYTPQEVWDALLKGDVRWTLPPPGWPVWEPCAGGGSAVRALRAAGYTVSATELDGSAESVRLGLAMQGDASKGCPLSCDYEVWTNPPFSLANGLLRGWMSSAHPPRRVVYLVLQAWIVAEERAWIWPYIRRQVLLYPRISFGGPGRAVGQTDMRDYCILDMDMTGNDPRRRSPTLHRLDWRAGKVS